MNQSELEVITCNRVKRKTHTNKSQLVSVLLLIGRESGARFISQLESEEKQNQGKTRITFDTQLKTALLLLTPYCDMYGPLRTYLG